MNKFKFDFNYIKKNLNQKNFLKDIYVLEKDSNKVSGDKYGGGDMFFKVIRNSFDGDDDTYGMLLNDYDDKKNKEFKLKINKYQFDGTLLPKLSENFKLEQYFDFCLESHYLIYSKSKKDYLYIFCHRPTFYAENASIYEKYDLVDNYVKEVLKKKLNKIQFFEFLIKRDKKIGLFQSYAYEGFYTSTDGIDYNYLYEQGKLK
ncbi:hypothetical protein OAR77_03915 [Candidatus Pelagibacter sp.]|nr:hypothetical protein [Candidatus Pelagibacter sp.]